MLPTTLRLKQSGGRLSVTLADLIPILAMLLYICQAGIMLSQGQYGFSFMWFAYAMANAGIIMAQKAGQQ